MSAMPAEDGMPVDAHGLLAGEDLEEAAEGVAAPDGVAAPEDVAAPEGVAASDGVAAPDAVDASEAAEAFPGERVALTDELTIYVAGERVAQLQHALHRCGALMIDLSGVTEIDTAGVQVLAFIRREAALRDRPLVYVAHSPVVLDALQLLGLDLQLETAVKPGARS